MFQSCGIKILLIIMIVSSLCLLWYLDTKYYHWDRILPQPDEMIFAKTELQSPENDTLKSKEFVPTNEWQIIEKGTKLNIIP